MPDSAVELGTGRTGGRKASTGVIAGRYALAVGEPDLPVPPGWSWTALCDLAQLESGHTPSRSHPEYWNGDIPWVGIRDAVSGHGQTIHDTSQHVTELGLKNSSARLLPRNTVCLSRTASVGFVVVMGRAMATSQDFVNWVCGPRLDPQYLKYVLVAENEALWRFASGTTHQTIYYPEAKAFHISLPPPTEQQAIVRVLCALDDRIDLNRRMNQTLEAMAQALFKDWFIDFGPVRAKMEGRQPYLAPSTWSLFPGALDDGRPRGWKIGQLDDLILLQRGFDLPASQRDEGQVPVIAASGPHGFHSEAKARGPGVITGRSGVLGRVFFVAEDYWPLNTTLWIKEFRLATPHFAFELLRTLDFSSFNAGSAVPTLNRNHVHGLPQALPSRSCIEAFERNASIWYRAIRLNEQQSNTLTALRDVLLPQLLSGALRIRDAEKLVGDAL